MVKSAKHTQQLFLTKWQHDSFTNGMGIQGGYTAQAQINFIIGCELRLSPRVISLLVKVVILEKVTPPRIFLGGRYTHVHANVHCF
jgi:hypothetical protein